MEEKELEVKHLIALRTNYFSMIMLISSGIAGTFFMNDSLLKIIILVFVGAYFDAVFISKFTDVNNNIKRIIKGE